MPDPRAVAPAATIVAIVAVIGVVLVGLVLWVISTIARGGLIAGASSADGGQSTSFSQAWNAGWRRGWRLLGIGLLPAIPTFLLVAVATGAAFFLGGLSRYAGREAGVPVLGGVGAVLAGLSCILIPLILVLGLLRTFANRACVLEDLGVFGSYGRGLRVLLDNFGPALVLFLIQIAIGIGIAVVGFLPGILAAVCCLLWPLLILVQGAIAAYFSTLWTLAWRRWTGLNGESEGTLSGTVA
jgi:hypothetical protein